MKEFTVTFSNGAVHDVLGTDQAEALQWAKTCSPVASITPKKRIAHDFDRGFGIGGLGRYEEPPVMPTIAQIKRMERIETQESCRRCGGSEWTGAMFTTSPSSGCCDDCFG